jgi:hypothetical protein
MLGRSARLGTAAQVLAASGRRLRMSVAAPK